MTATTPVKTVTFKLPADSRTSTPERLLSPQLERGSPKGATIAESPLTVKSTAIETAVRQSTPNAMRTDQMAQDTQRPKIRLGSEMQVVMRASPIATRNRSPLFEKNNMSVSQAAHVAAQLRERGNRASHEHMRLLKYEVAKLREHLLKVEEEIKHLNRGRHTLEIAIQDVRRALSVNQQSLSTQQKKSRGDTDDSAKLLREEAQVLSKAKRSVEHHLQLVKNLLQTLDSARKTLQAKIGPLSRALELDAQNLKLYDGPVALRADSVSRKRQYASGCPPPGTGTEDKAVGLLCTKVMDTVSASRTVRGEIKNLVVSVHARKIEAHDKITTAIARNVEQARAQKREILLDRGQVRVAQNSAHHQKHNDEIALGVALGPISDKHRSVSEKYDRPISRVRPASAIEERATFRETTTKLNRQLSATSLRASAISEMEQRLSRKLRDRSQSATLDSQTLRIRKISLDNRWVQ